MKSIGVIPAREGSKSIKNKNLIDVSGKPLIAWTIESALKSKLDKVVVSTDSKLIADISKDYGAEVPFPRPKKLSQDTSHTYEAIYHMVNNIDDKFDTVVTLQPTSPLRTHKHINEALSEYYKSKSNSLISITKAEFPPFWLLEIKDERVELAFDFFEDPFNLERQEFPELYKPNGAIYITDYSYLMDYSNLIDYDDCSYYIMDEISSIDIDTKLDYKLALEYMENKYEPFSNS